MMTARLARLGRSRSVEQAQGCAGRSSSPGRPKNAEANGRARRGDEKRLSARGRVRERKAGCQAGGSQSRQRSRERERSRRPRPLTLTMTKPSTNADWTIENTTTWTTMD